MNTAEETLEIDVVKELNSFRKSAEASAESFEEGSDEHLDRILTVTRPLSEVTANFERVNEYLFENINKFSDDFIRNTLFPEMRSLNKLCYEMRGRLISTSLYKDVRLALKRFIIQHNVLRELMHDLENYRLAQNDDLDSILVAIAEK